MSNKIQGKVSFWSSTQLSQPVAILICGKAGVGKGILSSCLVQYLKDSTKFIAVEESFAQPVKEIATTYFNWDGKKNDAGRDLLQSVGQHGRQINPNVWVRCLLDRIEGSFFDVVVINDWRYENEKEVFDNNFYQVVTIRVISPDRESLKGTKYYTDISEISLDNFKTDYVIENNGSLEDLQTKAVELARSIFEERRK